jgi:hypothetical protein
VVAPPLPQPLCLPASEAGNHRVNLSSHDNMSRCAVAKRFALMPRSNRSSFRQSSPVCSCLP